MIYSEESAGETREVAEARRVSLVNFRNFRTARIDLAERHNLLVGRNAQGKTNLLEAIGILSTTRSFRGAKEADILSFDAEQASIRAEIGHERTELEIQYNRAGRRVALLNGQRLPRVQHLIGRLPTVVFSATDLELIAGNPSDRRRFLDIEQSQASPGYLKAISTYKRSLEQRNAALRAIREGRLGVAALEPWEEKLAESGSIVRNACIAYVAQLAPIAQLRHADLTSGGETLDISHSLNDEGTEPETLLAQIVARRAADIAVGATSVGPHRDDVLIDVNGKPARLFGSQGQQRTAVLSVKLALVCWWRDVMHRTPVLLLDDIMSDLDAPRRELVMSASGKLGQVIITATEAEQVGPDLLESAKVFDVREGTVTER